MAAVLFLRRRDGRSCTYGENAWLPSHLVNLNCRSAAEIDLLKKRCLDSDVLTSKQSKCVKRQPTVPTRNELAVFLLCFGQVGLRFWPCTQIFRSRMFLWPQSFHKLHCSTCTRTTNCPQYLKEVLEKCLKVSEKLEADSEVGLPFSFRLRLATGQQ
ncbi:hypothetical protein HPB48_022094 [Haemaphysalis longicornis]|uniref:Uncharacterized protein n=1 Tax=Haemaphysalis longicornis TaxID=44386 RepID=A0A9J6FUJ6_HAELO|nr:hypothetical protein HPB48_022094 [Haemaphysalis longicornis]